MRPVSADAANEARIKVFRGRRKLAEGAVVVQFAIAAVKGDLEEVQCH
jgi:hypothetical protein